MLEMDEQNVPRCVGQFAQNSKREYEKRQRMIKVIASDLDGTLLNEHHDLNKFTSDMIKKAQEKGMRFIIATGRSFPQVEELITNHELCCDCLVSSGAEVRDSHREVVFSGHMKFSDCKDIYEVLKEYTVPFMFYTKDGDYCIGKLEELEQNVITHIFSFHQTLTIDEIKKVPFYKKMMENTKMVSSFEELEALDIEVIKIFIFSNDLAMLGEIQQKLLLNANIAVSSSFPNNLEITDVVAQKGPVLKWYIESLGYSMDEVMVFGDSMNDYSMLSMDFGATVAMENADEMVKAVSKYVTKSNIDDGVAYAIAQLLKHQR